MPESASGPQRTCLACRTRLDKNNLLRYVVAPDGAVVVDYRQKLPGRGAYTCLDLVCLNDAVKKKAFSRAFRGRCAEVDGTQLKQQLQHEVFQKALNLLGMARKSGNVMIGSNAVSTALSARRPLRLILVAEDISPGIYAKIAATANKGAVTLKQLLSKQALGRMLGKEEVSVIALLETDLAHLITDELDRYAKLVREN